MKSGASCPTSGPVSGCDIVNDYSDRLMAVAGAKHPPRPSMRRRHRFGRVWVPFPADPVFAAFPYLFLPDGHDLLQAIDREPARLERLGAVRRRHRDEHARLADLEAAGAVHHG